MFKRTATFLTFFLITAISISLAGDIDTLARTPAKARVAPQTGKIHVLVQLSDDSTIAASRKAMEKGANRALAVSAARAQAAVVEKAQREFTSRLQSEKLDARVLYRALRVFNGVALIVDASKVDQIRRMPGVKSVRPITLHTPTLFNSVPFQNVVAAWDPVGAIGSGIRVGIIDTGIDYAHANFGGNESYLNDTTIVGDHANFPSAKVVGGTDFAGDDYNASDPLNDVPVPDPDPLDCNGHGSHVAGIAGGLGVTDTGNTYGGPYDTTTHSNPFRIGPGVAPGVELYALRVFGCAGSTALTSMAIEWAVDPNGDFDTSDHLDVINMSLGSNFGSPDDDSTLAAEAAAGEGVIVVASAGNAGDTYYISGSPGTSVSTITVANSVDGFSVLGGLLINAPPAIAGQKAATEAVFGPDLSVFGDLTGDVVLVTDGVGATNDGCQQPFTNAGAVAGNIALIDRGTCSFKTKVRNAQNAGATGVIIANNAAGFPITMGNDAAITDTITIPSQMIGLADGNAIKAELVNTVNATLTAAFRNSTPSTDPALNDTLSSSSSRGPRRGGSFLKPDIAAVGDTVFSTQALSGDEGLNIGGTSMAAPHIAGAMAILREINPNGDLFDDGADVEKLKALIMNTATHDLFTGNNQTGFKYGDGRVGAGRLDVLNSVSSPVVAYNEDDDGAVSVSFGNVEIVEAGAGNDYTDSRTITLHNTTGTAVTYDVSIVLSNAGTDIPGVTFTPSAASVAVPGSGSNTLDVNLAIDASLMKHTRDSSVGSTQASPFGTLSRHWVSEETGYVVLTPNPAGPPVLRIPVYVAARPASDLVVDPDPVAFDAPSGTVTLTPTGTHLDTGVTFPNEIQSLASVFLLHEQSPDLALGNTSSNADLENVGVSYDSANDILNFGFSTYGDWSTPNEVTFVVYIDADQDGADDYYAYNSNLGSAGGSTGTDHPWTIICLIDDSSCFLENRVNFISPASRDSVLYNTNVLFLSFFAGDLGAMGGPGVSGPFDYHVETFSRDADGVVDSSGTHTFDISNPAIELSGPDFAGSPTARDLTTEPFDVNYNTLAFQEQGGEGILVLHHHNTAGSRSQVVDVSLDSDLVVTITDNPDPVFILNHVTYTVTVTNNGPANATGVVLASTASNQLANLFANDPNCIVALLTVTCPVGDLAVGESYSVLINAVAAGGPTATMTSTAVSDNNDPTPADATDIETTTTVSGPPPMNVTVDKVDTPDPVFNGTNLEYTITVTNNDVTSVAPSVVVTDLLPSSVVFVDATPSQGFCTESAGLVTCNIGDLAAAPGPGNTATVTINVTPTQPGVISNLVHINADAPLPFGPDTDIESTTVDANAELAVTKVADANPHLPGLVTYTIDVVNNGPDDAVDVDFDDNLPVNSLFQSLTAPAGWSCTTPAVDTSGLIHCDYPLMVAGETAQFVVVVNEPIAGGYINDVSVVSTTGDSDISNNTVRFFGAVLPASPAAPTACTATDTVFGQDVATPILDFNTVSSIITVSTPDTYLWDVNLITFLNFPSDQDLTITLTSPSGREVTLSSNNGCCGDYFGNTAWDDQANNPVTDFPFGGLDPATPLTVEEALGAFRGEDPNGDWTITITNTGGNTGSLDFWILHVNTLSATPNEITRSFSNNNTFQMPAVGLTTSTIDVAGAASVADVDMILNLGHIANYQNIITLTSPAGTEVVLSSFNGDLNTFAGTLWDDNAGDSNPPGPITDNTIIPGFASTPVVAESALSAFAGEDPNGTWTLSIFDTDIDIFELFFPPVLNNWSLNITSASCGSADLAITKVDDPDPVQDGDALHYTITVTNNGPDDATGVQVLDTLPNGVLFTSASAGCSEANGTVTCNVGDLAAAATATIDIYVEPTLGGLITNVACVSGIEADANGADNCDSEDTTVQLNPVIHTDLSITKADSEDPANVGGNFTYTLTVTNNGPDDSDGFTVTDTLPAEVTFVTASPECSFNAGTVTCVYPGPLADGASVNFTIEVTAANTAAPATNQACVAANDIDENAANDCDTEDTTIDPGATANADLALVKVDNPDPVQVNDSLHYALTVTNNGPDPVTDIVVTDSLHPTLTFVTASAACTNNAGTITCTAPTLASAASITFDIYVVPTLAGPIPNTACVSGFAIDANSANNCDTETTDVTLNPPGFTDLQLTKADSTDPVISTSTFTYLLTVTNNGPDLSQGFTITDTLPADVSFDSGSAGCTHDGSLTGGVVTCVFNGDLINGASTSMMVTVTAGNVLVQTVANNTACVVAENSDTVAANNCDTEDTTIDPVPPTSNADLAITKDDSFDPLQVGSLLTYFLAVTNNGPDTATQVHVIDSLHPSTTFLSASPGCVYDGNTHTVTCDIATMLSTETVQLEIQVGTTLAGTIINSACVSADFNNDANNANDCDSEGTTITITPPILTDLSMTKTASSGSVLAGNNITYTLAVFNDGPDVSTGHTVSDTLPIEVEFVSASAGCVHNGVIPGGTVTCQFGPLANNTSTSYTIVAKAVAAPQAVNNACVVADNFDLNATNDCDDATTLVTPTNVDLSLVKTGSPQSATVGGTVDYTITITNLGPDPSTGSTVVDTLPGEVQFLSASPGCSHNAGVVTCAIGALTVGNSTSVTITVEVVATGTFINSATVTGNDSDPVGANNTDTETTSAALCLYCDDFEDSALQPAGVWTYSNITQWSEDGDNLVAQPSGTGKTQAVAAPIFGGCQQCTVETSMSTAGGTKNVIWFLSWYVDDKNTMELLMKQEVGKWILKQRSNGTIVAKKGVKIPINIGQFHNVRITFNGSTFLVDIDAQTSAIALTPAAPVPTGTIGYRVKATTGRIAFIDVN